MNTENLYAVRKTLHRRIHTVLFHLYQVPEQEKLIYDKNIPEQEG